MFRFTNFFFLMSISKSLFCLPVQHNIKFTKTDILGEPERKTLKKN